MTYYKMIRRSVPRAAMLALAVVTLEAGALPAQATWGPSTRIGKSAESFGGKTCPSGKHAIGIEVRYGTYVNSIVLECAQLGPNGEHQSPELINPGIGGFSGTSTRTLRCASGKAMVGFQGRADWWVDRIQIACKSWNRAGGGTQGSVSWSTSAGGNGGQPYGPVLCPGQYAVHKLEGWYQTFIPHGWLVYGYTFSCKAAA